MFVSSRNSPLIVIDPFATFFDCVHHCLSFCGAENAGKLQQLPGGVPRGVVCTNEWAKSTTFRWSGGESCSTSFRRSLWITESSIAIFPLGVLGISAFLPETSICPFYSPLAAPSRTFSAIDSMQPTATHTRMPSAFSMTNQSRVIAAGLPLMFTPDRSEKR